jgi:eukaryotic-like serine/threonine-protein kinase
MNIAKDAFFGPYQVLGHIGSGGMGEVWRARDPRIGRDVAVKVLPKSLGIDDKYVRRFEQEARAAGALNHPGLITIFDVGTTGQCPYIVMELLEGRTLREAMGDPVPTPIPIRKTIEYAIQIASALAVAHEKGIIHRDLKPENLFITDDGRVKILDFGLAKLAQEATDTDGNHRTARHLTSVGIAVGTPGYMSPEQARGLALDHRTDVFSLGSVLYEMLSGKPAFDCPSAVETMHAVLSVEPPPLTTIDPEIPPAAEAIVSHCMEKNPVERFQSARDLAFQLRMLQDMQTTTGVRNLTSAAPEPRSLRRWIAAAIGVAGVLLAGGFALMAGRGEPPGSPRVFRQLTFADGVEMFPTLAPDGKSLAYAASTSGNRDIYVQRVDGRTAIDITADSPDDDSEPAFSPDGGQIAFRSERDGGGIFVMGVTGESVRRLTDKGHNPAWSPDGTRIVYSTAPVALRPHIRNLSGALWVVDIRTGATRALVQPRVGSPDSGRDSDAVQPSWSPHGNRIAFWQASADGRRIFTIDPDAPRPQETVVPVTSDSKGILWNPVWSPDGNYLYYGSNEDGTLNLWRVAMEETSGKPLGEPEPVSLPGSTSGNFAFSHQGEIAFTTLTRSYRLLAIPFDESTASTGMPRPLLGGSQEIMSFAPSPDGKSIAFTTGGVQEDVFAANSDGTRLRQLTNDPARDRDVSWSPDGKVLYFHSNRDGSYHIWSIHADGSALTRVTDDREYQRLGVTNSYAPVASPDGRTLAVQTPARQALIHLDRPAAQRLELLGSHLGLARWSPDGQRLIGDSGGSIVLYSLPARRAETIRAGGSCPQWAHDGRRIVFFDKGGIGIFDLASRRETKTPFLRSDIQLDFTSILSRDGSTLYARQTIEQGDIWLMTPGKK